MVYSSTIKRKQTKGIKHYSRIKHITLHDKKYTPKRLILVFRNIVNEKKYIYHINIYIHTYINICINLSVEIV